MRNEELTVDVAREIRADLSKLINRLYDCDGITLERKYAIKKLKEGRMWMGMVMGDVGGEDLNAKRDKEIMESK